MLAPAAAERVHAEHAAAARGAEHAAPGEQGQAAPRQLPQRGQPHSSRQAQGGHSLALVIPDEAGHAFTNSCTDSSHGALACLTKIRDKLNAHGRC